MLYVSKAGEQTTVYPREHGSGSYLFGVAALLGGQRTSKPTRELRDHGID